MLGLTGVGKSTAVQALKTQALETQVIKTQALETRAPDTSSLPLTLLPNRRTLTDELIVPTVQRAAGEPIRPVTDRLERFALTRRYRALHPGGMVAALERYLEKQSEETGSGLYPGLDKGTWVFDNLRGLDEARAGAETFPDARFILLDAPPLVRLERLIGRRDSFDQVTVSGPENTSLGDELRTIDQLETVFDVPALEHLAAQGALGTDIVRAARIIVGEAQNYDMTAAAAYLQNVKDDASFLYLDTAVLSVKDVRTRIQRWL